MAKWRKARDGGQPLAADEQSELESLINSELQAADERTRQILKRLEE